jgi:drug/metabolite transporter (DMT)-like permease
MKNLQTIADKTAISLSFVCALHCLALPLLLLALPTFSALNLMGEALHLWLLIVVVPTSFVALALGCKKHNNLNVLLVSSIGLMVMIAAALAGHDLLGETIEKTMTLAGAIFIAIGHYFNHRLCQKHSACHGE